jgi:uncharacterized membrane protein
MQAALQLLLFWALAFVTLCAAVASLNIFYRVIENDRKISHFEDWRNGDVFMLLVFQLVIGAAGSLLLTGHFGQASFVLAGFGIILAVIAAFPKFHFRLPTGDFPLKVQT